MVIFYVFYLVLAVLKVFWNKLQTLFRTYFAQPTVADAPPRAVKEINE